ncbi:MAG: class I SAM-dependent rRNA methyltransferase [Gemmataceae bacterium]|nr:class I SAM-dependent rRNA methyltransferase [Gemmataceae bacterium]MCI0742131.1 class I SAM-dependent rRNA methyltransferase [Gemmataceae bacterium]
MSLPRVILKPKRARPFFGRHPWVFAGAVAEVQGEPADGAVVDLVSHAGNFIARGLYNSRSKIRVRLYSWDSETALDESFFRERLARAVALRRDVLGLGGPGQACRLVFSEADGLSGLAVDQYDRWLVVQFTGLGLAERRDMFAGQLADLLQPEGIYLRTERGIGQLEGLELHDGLLRGQVPREPIVIEENGVRFHVLLTEGQKTGFYLDQRDNRQVVAKLARDRRVLDAFCYSGGFGLHAAKAGAAQVLGVDASEPALELARGNARLNELDNITYEKHDVFDKLDALVDAGEQFGMVILDPPKFARAGHAVEEAMRGYRQLQTQAIKLLEPGGKLVVCCCSGLITRDMLHDLLAQLSAEHKRDIQILESRGPAPDHPTAATCPETQYLKCIICRL